MHWRRKWQPTPVFLPGESQGRGSLVGCYLWGRTESARLKQLSSSSSSFYLKLDSSIVFCFMLHHNSASLFWNNVNIQSVPESLTHFPPSGISGNNTPANHSKILIAMPPNIPVCQSRPATYHQTSFQSSTAPPHCQGRIGLNMNFLDSM